MGHTCATLCKACLPRMYANANMWPEVEYNSLISSQWTSCYIAQVSEGMKGRREMSDGKRVKKKRWELGLQTCRTGAAGFRGVRRKSQAGWRVRGNIRKYNPWCLFSNLIVADAGDRCIWFWIGVGGLSENNVFLICRWQGMWVLGCEWLEAANGGQMLGKAARHLRAMGAGCWVCKLRVFRLPREASLLPADHTM